MKNYGDYVLTFDYNRLMIECQDSKIENTTDPYLRKDTRRHICYETTENNLLQRCPSLLPVRF